MTRPGRVERPEPGHCGRGARPVVAADIGYGDNTLFLQHPIAADWQYATAVKGGTTAHGGDAVPQARPDGELGQPPKHAYPHPSATVRRFALAHAGQVRPVTWRQGTKASLGQPRRRHDQLLPGHPGPPAAATSPHRRRHSPARWLLAEWCPEADEPADYWLSILP